MAPEDVEVVLEPLHGHTRYAPLAVIGYWLRRVGYLDPLWATLDWPVRAYKHTVVQKLETLLASMLVGNRAIYQINTSIRPDLPLAHAWGQDQFVEQSIVADLLDKATPVQVEQLQQGITRLMREHSRALRHDFAHWLLIDYDTTGLLVSKHAEGSEKGYFTGHRNRYGRHLVRVAAPAYHETIGSFMYPGRTLAFSTLKPVMKALEERLPLTKEQRQRTIVRTDAGIGTDANIDWLLSQDYRVLSKGFSHTRAAAQARLVATDDWLLDPNQERWIAPAPAPRRYGRKVQVYVMRWQSKSGYRYGTLVNSVPALPMLSAWRLCDGRGAVEVEIRADKQGLKLPKRRKHRLPAQVMLVLLTDVAHNLLSWLHAATLADGPCSDFGALRMVEDLLCIPGRLEFKGPELQKVALLETHPFAPHMGKALLRLLSKTTIP